MWKALAIITVLTLPAATQAQDIQAQIEAHEIVINDGQTHGTLAEWMHYLYHENRTLKDRVQELEDELDWYEFTFDLLLDRVVALEGHTDLWVPNYATISHPHGAPNR